MAMQGAVGASGATIAEIARLADQDRPAATKLAAGAKARGVRAPLIHYLIGSEFEDARRYDAAVAEFGLGLVLAPNDARLISSVGRCLIKLGRLQEALAVFTAALNADPSSADASFGYGWAAASLGAADSAETAFQRAIDLNPAHADALAGVAGLALERGDWTRARIMAMDSIAARPANLDALMTLARLDIDQEAFNTAEARLTAILETADLDPSARPEVLVLLGDAFDGQGRYGEALDQYRIGNAERAKAHKVAEGSSATDTVRKIASSFHAVGLAKREIPAAAKPELSHLIVAGFPHSGVESVGALLAVFSGVSVLDQTPLLTKAENAFLERPDGMARLAEANDDDLEGYRADYWSRARQFGANETVLVDVQPLAAVRMPILKRLFPTAAFIYVSRDPRDVVWDCFRHDQSEGPVGRAFADLVGAAEFYDAVMTATEAYFTNLNILPIRIAAEDIDSDLAKVLQRLSKSLGSPKPPIPVSRARSKLDRGPRQAPTGHWRNYAAALETVRTQLEPWVAKFGYEPW